MAGTYEIVIVGGEHDGAAIAVNGRLTVGSARGNAIQLHDPQVRANHAQFAMATDGSLWVGDLTGENLTFVNGNPVQQAQLAEGSRIQIGTLTFQVRRAAKAQQPGVQTDVVKVRTVGDSGAIPLITPAFPTSSKKPSGRVQRPSDGGEYVPPTETVRRAVIVAGQIIGARYQIIELLAAGGMGEVYKAMHVDLGKVFALKVMKHELSDDPEFVDRFKREAFASSRIGQHNIVDISDFGRTDDGRFYFVMEYLDGVTLSELIKTEHAVSPERAVQICLQIARALGAAHNLGIVHRDLKPENVILLQRDGHPDFVKVLDFGVAKVNEGRGKGGHTAVGIVVGTPQYMSPEQAAAIAVDSRSDVYSLGLILFELIAGHVVFDGQTPSIIMAAHMKEPAPEVTSALKAPIDPLLSALVSQMLAKRPEHRPQSMAEVVQVFEVVLGLPSRATPMRGVAVSPQDRPSLATPVRPSEAPKRSPSGAVLPPALSPSPSTSSPQLASVAPSSAPSGSRRVSAVQPAQAVEPQAPTEAVAAEPTLPPEAVRRSRAPLVLLAAGVAALGVVAFLAMRQPTSAEVARVEPAAPAQVPTPTPVPVPAPAPVAAVAPAPTPAEPEKPKVTTVQLAISSSPSHLEVFSDELLIGKTPLTLNWEKGKVMHLTVKGDGYLPETRTLAPEADFDVQLQLKPVVRKPVRQAPAEPSAHEDELKDAPY